MKDSFLQKLIDEKGHRFFWAGLPSDILRGTVGDCFDHCLLEALKSNGKYRYCEGYALFKGKFYHHAWLTDETGKYAYDPTWQATNRRSGKILPMTMVHYIGVILDMMLVKDFVIKTEYKSPLANHFRDPELAEKIYQTAL